MFKHKQFRVIMLVSDNVNSIKVDKLSFKNKIECHFFIYEAVASVLNNVRYEF